MHRRGLGRIEFAVLHPAPGAHSLHVAGDDRRAVAHAVAVRKLAVQHVADDLHVAMAVRAEAHAGLHAILVDDAQRSEGHVRGIVVIGKREAVPGIQPAVLGMSPFQGFAQRDHDDTYNRYARLASP